MNPRILLYYLYYCHFNKLQDYILLKKCFRLYFPSLVSNKNVARCYIERVTREYLKKLDFVYFEAGGGHRAAAQALKSVIEEQQRPWEVRLVNLQEILDPLDIFRKYTGIRMEDVYNLLLKKGWTLGSPQLTVLMHGLIRLYHRRPSPLAQRNSGRRRKQTWWFR